MAFPLSGHLDILTRKPGIRGPSSVVLAASREVPVGSPSAYRISMRSIYLSKERLLVEEVHTGPEEGHTGLGEVRIDPEEDRSNYDSVSRQSIWSDVLLRLTLAGAAEGSSSTFWMRFV